MRGNTYISAESCGDFSEYGFDGSVKTTTNSKSSAESEKFFLRLRSESGKLLTFGGHFPPKSTNFGHCKFVYLAISCITLTFAI